jgi:flagellar hook-associated protein 2
MAGLGGYNATTKTAGAMLGDSMLQTIQTQVRRTATMVVSGGSSVYNTLSAIGVVRDDTNKADVTGKLKVDTTKLQAALTADSQSVSKVLAGTGGIATAFATVLDKHTETQTGGADLATREATIAARTKDIAKQKTALETHIADYKARQTAIFNALDGMLSKMQTTSSQLTQALSKSTTG